MPEISIVMAVYNAQEWIKRSLKSCQNQTFSDLEIICVDDCSSDCSVEMIKAEQKKDKRIVLLQNEKNMGPGQTRNRAISVAKGKYLAFIDADDFYEPDAMETLYQLIRKYKTKAVFANWNIFQNGTKIPQKKYEKKLYTVDKEADGFFISPWAKLMDLDFIRRNRICFGSRFFADDCLFQFKILANCDQIYLTDACVYNWSQENVSSITKDKRGSQRAFDFLEAMKSCYQYMQEKKPAMFNPQAEAEKFYYACGMCAFKDFKKYCREVSSYVNTWSVSKSDFDRTKVWKKYIQLKHNQWFGIFMGTKVKKYKRACLRKIKTFFIGKSE